MTKINLQLKVWLITAVAMPIALFVPLRALAHMITIGGHACVFDDFGDGSVAFFSIVVGFTVAACMSCLCCVYLKSSSKFTRVVNALILVIITFALLSDKFNKAQIFDKSLSFVRQFCTTSFPAPTASDAAYTHSNQLVAIRPYTSVEFTTRKGTLKISAGKGILREIEFQQNRKRIEVDSIYYSDGFIDHVPACSKWPGRKDWAGGDGVPPIAYQENVQDTQSLPELIRLLKSGFVSDQDVVFTTDGLCLGWYLTESPVTLVIVVRQYLIKGRKPTNFPGASEDKVKVSQDH